ncbi:MAG: universal stress protein [Deltaproteobacteria bacterium]|nr:universal stress protein [Deltaproteobacteria bacterium]
MLWTNVLLAYDSSAPALRAVEYVGQMYSKVEGAKVTLFLVEDKLPGTDMVETHFTSQVKARIGALEREQEARRQQMDEAKKHLLRMGFDDSQVKIKIGEKKKSVAKAIIDEVKTGQYGTVVVGRRGASDIQNMLFGSVASSVISNLQGATICVVE